MKRSRQKIFTIICFALLVLTLTTHCKMFAAKGKEPLELPEEGEFVEEHSQFLASNGNILNEYDNSSDNLEFSNDSES